MCWAVIEPYTECHGPYMRIIEAHQDTRQSSQGRLKRDGGFFIEPKELVGLGYLKKKGKHVLREGAAHATGKGK